MKTKAHIYWETAKELRGLKKTLTEKDNEILALTVKNSRLKELNTTLILRIKDELDSK